MKQKYENWVRLAELLRIEIPKKTGATPHNLGNIEKTITDLKIFYAYVSNHQDPQIRALPLKHFLDVLLDMPLGRGRIIKGRYFGGSKQKELAKHLHKFTADLRKFSESKQSAEIFKSIVTEANAFTASYPGLYKQMSEHIHFMLNTMQFLTLSQLHHVKSSPVQFKDEDRPEMKKVHNLHGEFIPLMDKDLEWHLIERGFTVNGTSAEREKTKILVEQIDKASIAFDSNCMTYKLKNNAQIYTSKKTQNNSNMFERIKKKHTDLQRGEEKVELAVNYSAESISDLDLIHMFLMDSRTTKGTVTTLPLIGSYINDSIRANIAQSNKKNTATRCLVLVPHFAKIDDSIAGKIDMDVSKDLNGLFEYGITEGHWAYLHIEHSNDLPPVIKSIRLDDAKLLSQQQQSYIEIELSKLTHKYDTTLPRAEGLQGGQLTDNWSGGYHALASLLVQAEKDGSFSPKGDPLFEAAKDLKNNEDNQPQQNLEQFAKEVFRDLELQTQHLDVDQNKFAPLSKNPARLQDESAIIILAELIGTCITRRKNGHALALSYEGEGPGRTVKDINRERLGQESAMFVLNGMKLAYEKKQDLEPTPDIDTRPSTPYDLWRTNYIVSRPVGKEKLGVPEVDDPDVPELPSLVRDYAPRDLPPQEQAQSQYTDEGAYEGAVNIVNGNIVENMSTQGAFVNFPGATRMSELERKLQEGEAHSILPTNLLARGVRTPTELKRNEHAPLHFRRHSESGLSHANKHLVGYVHGMVSAIPKALEMQWEKLVDIGKQMFPDRNLPNQHGLDFLNSLNSEERAKLIQMALPSLLDPQNVSITEVLIGNCTTKTSSCYGCTSYINALGLTPSASHLGGSYSWIPPIPQMPPFENASPIMEWILPELYKKYCNEMQIYLNTGVDAIEAYIQEGHTLGATLEEQAGLARALRDLKQRLTTDTPAQVTAFYLDALTVHKKTIERPLNMLPRESVCAKIALELAILLKEPRDKILEIQSGKINLKSYINSKPLFDIEQAIVLAQVNSNTKPEYFRTLLDELFREGEEHLVLVQALISTPLNLVSDGSDFRKAGSELFTMKVVKWLSENVPKFADDMKYVLTSAEGRQAIMQDSDAESFNKALDYALSQNSFYIEEAFLKNNLTKKEKKPVNKSEIESEEKQGNEYYTLLGDLKDVGRRLRSDYIVDPTLNQRMETILKAKAPGQEAKIDPEEEDLMFLKINDFHRKVERIVNARNMMDTLVERVAIDILQMWYPRFNEPGEDKTHYDEHLLKLNRVHSKLPESFADLIKAQVKINAEIDSGHVVKSQFGTVLSKFPMQEKFAQYQYALYGESRVKLPPLAQLGTPYQYLKEYYLTFPILIFNKSLHAFNRNKNNGSALYQSLKELFDLVRINACHLDDYCLSKWSEVFKDLNRELDRKGLDENAFIEIYKEKYSGLIEHYIYNTTFQVNSSVNKTSAFKYSRTAPFAGGGLCQKIEQCLAAKACENDLS